MFKEGTGFSAGGAEVGPEAFEEHIQGLADDFEVEEEWTSRLNPDVIRRDLEDASIIISQGTGGVDRTMNIPLESARRAVAQEIIEVGSGAGGFVQDYMRHAANSAKKSALVKGTIVDWVHSVLPEADYDGDNISEGGAAYWAGRGQIRSGD
ncbi:MAG: hypothetical protein WCO52_02090 [bacterium]